MYKIQRRKEQYRTILPQDGLKSPWFNTRIDAVYWAIRTIESIDKKAN